MSELNSNIKDDVEIPDDIVPGGGVDTIPSVQEFITYINIMAKVYPDPDEAIRDNRESARAMRRSLIVMEPLRARQLSTACLSWHLEPEDAKDPEQVACVRDLTRIIQDIPDFLQLKMSLLEAVFFGKWGAQLRYRWDFTKGRKRMVVAGWTPVHGDSIKVRFDEPGKFDILVMRTAVGKGTKDLGDRVIVTDVGPAYQLSDWDRKHFIFHKHEISTTDYFDPRGAGFVAGMGLRSLIYWTWHLYSQALAWLVAYTERVGMGKQIYRYPLGNEKAKTETVEMAEAQSWESISVIGAEPERKWKEYELIEPSGNATEHLLRIAQDFFGGQIKRMILGQHLSSEVAGSGIGSHVADFQEKTFERIVRYDATNMGETLTKDLVSVLMEYNYPDADYKVKLVVNVDKPDPSIYLTAAQQLYNMGADIDADELRSIVGLSKPTKDSSILRRTMTGLEEDKLSNAGSINDKQQTDNMPAQEEGKAKKIDQIKAAINELGVNARASDILTTLRSKGLQVSESMIYTVLRDLRGRQFHSKEKNVGK